MKIALYRPALASLFAFAVSTAPAQISNQFVNFEGKQTSPVRLSPDGTRLFAVNTPDARLSVFDVTVATNPVLIAEIPVGLEPVSVAPRNNDEVWVVNEVSDSISVVSIPRRVVIDTLRVKDEPADVVFAGNRAFVTAARRNQIAVFDALTRAAITNIPVFGENPRSIVANAAGTRVYAAFALSGNRTTVVPPERAPAQPTDLMRPGLPAPPQVSRVVDATDPAWTTGADAPIRFTMPDHDVVEIDTATLAITRYFSRVGTINLGLAIQPGSGNLFVANTDARNLVQFEPVLRGNFISNRVTRIDVNTGAATHHDLNPGFTYASFPDRAAQSNALAQPTALVFGPSGNNYYVAAFGSDRVAQVNAASGAVVQRIELNPAVSGSAADPRSKRGPRGLALKPGQALYVLNRLANSLSVIQPVTATVVRELPVGSHDPTPAFIRQGRGFLYDARLSGAGTVSCASCHIDAEMDLIAWDLGNPQGDLETVVARVSGLEALIPGGLTTNFTMHPMKGPMSTQTLRGLRGTDPLHWRGDRTNFLHFNGAFDALMGGSLLAPADMVVYREFIDSIAFQPNPNQNLDRTLPARFMGADPVAGRNAYLNTAYQPLLNLRCNTCHALPTGTDLSLTPAAALQLSQDIKVPHLRNVYQKVNLTRAPGAQSVGGFGLVHDGVDPNLFAFLSRPVFGTFANNTIIKSNLQAFVLCFDTGTAPAVGHSRTLTAGSVTDPAVIADWNVLEAQARLRTNIDLVVKGTLDGRLRGLLFQPATSLYRSDRTGVGPFTREQLRTRIAAGDTLTIMGVPPGSGLRLGLDRNLDGVTDGDAAVPALAITREGDRATLRWSTNAPGFVLEVTDALAGGEWRADGSPRGVNGDRFSVTTAIGAGRAYWRLREL